MPLDLTNQERLNRINGLFKQQPLRCGVLINELPHCDGRLLQTILGLFIPLHQQQSDADPTGGEDPSHHSVLQRGQMRFSYATAKSLLRVRQMVLVMDPHQWVLHRARQRLLQESGAFTHYQEPRLSVDHLLNLMISGHNGLPSLFDVYTHHAVAWLNQGALLIQAETLMGFLSHLDETESARFMQLLCRYLGLNTPADWQDRVMVGLDLFYEQMGGEPVASAHPDLPAQLPEAQRALVEYSAPGLRARLGYI